MSHRRFKVMLAQILAMVIAGFSVDMARSEEPADRDFAVVTPNIGHQNLTGVSTALFSPSGRHLVSISNDGTMKVWDFTSGRLLRTMSYADAEKARHGFGQPEVRFAPDGQYVVLGLEDGSLQFWSLVTGRLMRTLEAHSAAVTSIEFFEQGTRLATRGKDGRIRVWTTTGSLVREFNGTGFSYGNMWLPQDGTKIINEPQDSEIQHWDVKTGKLITPEKRQKQTALRSNDGRFLVYRTEADQVGFVIHDRQSGSDTANIESDSNKTDVGLRSIEDFSPDQSILLTSEWESNGYKAAGVSLWDVSSGRMVQNFRSGFRRPGAGAFSPDGRWLVTYTWSRAILDVWNIRSGKKVRTIGTGVGEIKALGVAPNGREVVAVDNFPISRIWDLEEGRLIRGDDVGIAIRGAPEAMAHFNALHKNDKVQLKQMLSERIPQAGRMALTQDGTKLAASIFQWDAPFGGIWDTRKGQLSKRLQGSDAPFSAAFSSDGTRLVVADDQRGGQHIVFTVLDQMDDVKKTVFQSPKGFGEVNAIQIAPNNKIFATANPVSGSGGDIAGGIHVWDVNTGRLLKSIETWTRTVAFSPDSRSLVAASGKFADRLKRWDISSGQVLWASDAKMGPPSNIAFSMGGSELLVGGDAGTVTLLEADTGKAVRRFTGHLGGVNAVSFADNGRLVVAGGSDSSLRVWEKRSGRLLASFFGQGEKDWLAITPEGFFASSKRGASLLSIVRGFEIYSIEQVYDALYRPDLVKEALAGDPRGKVKAAASKLDLNKIIETGLPPTIRVLTPQENTESGTGSVTVEVELEDRGGGFGQVEWRVNGTTQGLKSRGLKRVGDKGSRLRLEQKLFLSPGENIIQIVAHNSADLIATDPVSISVNFTGETVSKSALHVLAIGVDDYWDSRLNLKYAVSDATTFSAGLKKAGSGLYSTISVKTILNEAVTRKGIEAAFTELGKSVGANDVFVFFLAGHGKTIDGRYYFIPHDFRYKDEDSIQGDGIGQNLWQAWFAKVKAQKSVLLYDTCESGSLTGDQSTRGLAELAALERLTRAMGRTILTASTDTTPALEGYRGHGAFTYTLLEALANADSDNDQQIEVTELATYIDKALPALSFKVFGHRQVPQMKIVGNSFPLVRPTVVLASAEPIIPKTNTHFVIKPVDVHKDASTLGEMLRTLATGMAVRVIEVSGDWALIARNGRRVGYVRSQHLVAIQ